MLKDVLAISGQSGLYKRVSEASNKLIVESLETGKRMPVFSSLKISALEDIAIYTEEEEMPLVEIFHKIYEMEDGGEAISHKASANELKSYFAQVLPDYDKDRVYVSDIKKVIQWYNILSKKGLITPKKTESSNENETDKAKNIESK